MAQEKVNEEIAVRNKVLDAGAALDMMSVMGMNRHQRRAMAKVNRINKIPASNKPFLKKVV